MTNKLPPQLIKSLQGIEGFDKENFQRVHESGEKITSIRFNPLKLSRLDDQWVMKNQSPLPFTTSLTQVPWSEFGAYLKERPSFTFDPLFHAGCYYVQEASGMFLEQVFKQYVDPSQPLRVLDLCAAPGGKSTHVQSLISRTSLLVSNEVIQLRSRILTVNMIKWGSENVMVTKNDPKDFNSIENYFDVILIDAPCSGSGLFRKDPAALEEWSENNVSLCAMRQKRILADVLPSLKEDGILIYATCSYSKEEDEDIADWLVSQFPISNLQLAINEAWNIVESKSSEKNCICYRFFPDKVKGEGFFICVFKKEYGKEKTEIPAAKNLTLLSKTETLLTESWVNKTNHSFVKKNNIVFAIEPGLLNDLAFLEKRLNVAYAGTTVGAVMKNKIVPDHALAMSSLANDSIRRLELSYENSIQYLKKKEIQCETSGMGWQLACFRDIPIGWMNVLSNRVNNYYPKELRILKD